MITDQHMTIARELLTEHLEHHPRTLALYQADPEFQHGVDHVITAVAAMTVMLERRLRITTTEIRTLALGALAELLTDDQLPAHDPAPTNITTEAAPPARANTSSPQT